MRSLGIAVFGLGMGALSLNAQTKQNNMGGGGGA